MKTKNYIFTAVLMCALFAWANPIIVQGPAGTAEFLPPAIPLLVESLIIAVGIKLKGLKFWPMLAFWFLLTNLTFLPAQWLYKHTTAGILMVEGLVVLFEALILSLWLKKKIGKRKVIYPLILVFIANAVSFSLGQIVVAVRY